MADSGEIILGLQIFVKEADLSKFLVTHSKIVVYSFGSLVEKRHEDSTCRMKNELNLRLN